LSSATDLEARAGHAPESPEKLSRSEWIASFRRAFSKFMKDDCMGLSQQVAYSSLLAFFPAVAFLIGALGLFNLFDDVKQLLDPIAPNGVITFIDSLQQDSQGETSAAAFAIGLVFAVWVASGAMTSVIKTVNRAYERPETRPFWKTRATAIVLVVTSGITTAGIFLLIEPFMYAVVGWLLTAIFCLLYNLAARFTGGIAVEVVREALPPPAPALQGWGEPQP